MGVTPRSLRPQQQGGALGENRRDRRHSAQLGGQQAASKCCQPEMMVWRALANQQCFDGASFNSLCMGRAHFLMACTKAKPALPQSPAACPCSAAVVVAVPFQPRGGRSGDKAEAELNGSLTQPQPHGQLQLGDRAGEQGGQPSPCCLLLRLWESRVTIKMGSDEGRAGEALLPGTQLPFNA